VWSTCWRRARCSSPTRAKLRGDVIAAAGGIRYGVPDEEWPDDQADEATISPHVSVEEGYAGLVSGFVTQH
jgi:hypothetical protein